MDAQEEYPYEPHDEAEVVNFDFKSQKPKVSYFWPNSPRDHVSEIHAVAGTASPVSPVKGPEQHLVFGSASNFGQAAGHLAWSIPVTQQVIPIPPQLILPNAPPAIVISPRANQILAPPVPPEKPYPTLEPKAEASTVGDAGGQTRMSKKK